MSLQDTWDELKSRLKIGDIVNGKVVMQQPFGYFVNIGGPFLGLLEVMNIPGTSKIDTTQHPQVGAEISAIVLSFNERSHQIGLGLKNIGD